MKYHLLFSFFLFFISCTKDKVKYNVPCNVPTNEKEISINLFQGNWSWVSELYQSQINGQYFLKTPTTEGYSRQLIFRSLTELEFFKNNISTTRYLYSVDRESTITLFSGDIKNVLIFKEYPSGIYYDYVHFQVCNDTLVMNFQITTSIKGKEKWVKN